MKRNEIKLLNNNDNRDWSDLEWVQEFYSFLQGEVPGGLHFSRGHAPNLSQKKAFSIIWYLQEHFPIIPDRIEKCDVCGQLFDIYAQGHYDEKKGKSYCYMCDDVNLYP